jgi:hypothetical protein
VSVEQRMSAQRHQCDTRRSNVINQLADAQLNVKAHEMTATTAIEAARQSSITLSNEKNQSDDRLRRSRDIIGLYSIISNIKFDDHRCDTNRLRGTIHLPVSRQVRSFNVNNPSTSSTATTMSTTPTTITGATSTLQIGASSMDAFANVDSLWNIIEADNSSTPSSIDA